MQESVGEGCVCSKYISTPTCENGVIFCVPRFDSFAASEIHTVSTVISKINLTVRELLKSQTAEPGA
jgi:hypothetical protein